MAKNLIVEQITRLSQQEGLNDSEIGEQLGYARGSIQRIRRTYNIPVANKENRKDKLCKCMKCDKKFYIRRGESDNLFCPECEITENAAYDKMLNDKGIQ